MVSLPSFRRITIIYLVAMGVVILLSLLGYFVQDRITTSEARYDRMIHQSDERVLLIQQVLYQSQSLIYAPSVDLQVKRDELNQAIADLSDVHNRLIHEDNLTPELYEVYLADTLEIDQQLAVYLSQAHVLVSAPERTLVPTNPSWQALEGNAQPLIEKFKIVTTLYRAQADQERNLLVFAQVIRLGLIMLAIVLITLFIFRPLVQRLRVGTSRLEMLSLVASKTDNGVIITDANGCTEWVNQSFIHTSGYTLEEFIGKRPSRILSGEGTDLSALEALDVAVRNGQSLVLELLVYKRDHTPYWISANISPVYNAKHQLEHFVVIQADITHWKNYQATLEESETRYRTLVAALSEGIIQQNADGVMTSCNQSAEQILGHKAELLLNRNAAEIPPWHALRTDGSRIAPQDLPPVLALRTGKPIRDYILGLKRKEGNITWVSINSEPLLKEQQERPYAVVSSFFDITARVDAEQRLRTTLNMNQAILDGADLTIISTDPNGLIKTINHTAERLLCYSADEVVGQLNIMLFHDGEEIAQRTRQLSAELDLLVEPGFEVLVAHPKRGISSEREWHYVRKDGSSFPVVLSITELQDSLGNTTGFVWIGRDITASKAVDRLKSEFVSMVSHELRTPLTSIMGALSLLAGGVVGPLPAQAKAMIDVAQKNSERLVRLINDILDIERIESGKMRFEFKPLALVPLIEHALDANRAYAASFGVRLEVAASLPEVTLQADADRLIQVLTNLIANAAKFSPPGDVVWVWAERQDGRVRLSVADNGPGIPLEFQSRIFQRFAQADASNTRARGGSGLGLSIARAIVERHDGHIGFETTPGQGSTFYVDLPVVAELVPDS